MAHSGVKVTAPVSFDDLNDIWGTNYKDLATICKTRIIKKWARFKPVRFSQVTPLTHSQRLTVKFGLDVPYVTDSGALMNGMVQDIMNGDNTEDWGYNKPSGGSSPYRLSDFAAKPNDATTTPWVSSLGGGYNHSAPFPCTVSIQSSHVNDMGDNTYEVNVQAVSRLVFTIQNASGDDLCIQDFVNWGIVSSEFKWKPVLQVFYPDGTTPWYRVSRPTAVAVGTEITYNRSTALTVELPTAGLATTQYFHICIGIGCCDSSGDRFPSSTERLFIVPYDRTNSARFIPQFYYKIRFVNYLTHHIEVKEVWYYNAGVWTQATDTGGSQSFVVGTNITSGDIGVVMEIERTDIGVYFVPVHSSLSVSPKFYIGSNEYADPNTPCNFYPQNSSWQTPNPNRIEIPADPNYSRTSSLKMTVYAKVPNGIRGSVTSFTYHMKSQIDSAGWVDVNSFSIRKS